MHCIDVDVMQVFIPLLPEVEPPSATEAAEKTLHCSAMQSKASLILLAQAITHLK